MLAAAGALAAKPPGLPVGPLVEGVEPTPLARDFYEAVGPRPSFGAGVVPPGWSGPGEDATPLADLILGVRDAVLNRLTVPLGTVPLRE
jgi:hypothetical protein